MTSFHDMTRTELEEAIAAELREFMTGLDAPLTSAEAQSQILRHLASYDTHFELVAHPQTEAEKAARYSARMELRAKTAWGHLEIVRQGYAEGPR